MAGIFKLIVALVLAAALAAGTWYFANLLYFNPKKLDRLENEELARQAAEAAQPPPVDFTIAILEKLAANPDTATVQSGLRDFILQYPDSSRITQAKALLGEANANILFSTEPSPIKEAYTVGKGDALVKIANKYQTNAEMLMRVNNLLTHNLQIGQVLMVPKFVPRIVINPKKQTLTVLNGDEFFKEYPIELSGKPTAQTTKISDKVAIKDNKRVAFGTKEYVDADRSLTIAGGLMIRPKGDIVSGIMLPREDVEEIFTLVSIGTPVVIE